MGKLWKTGKSHEDMVAIQWANHGDIMGKYHEKNILFHTWVHNYVEFMEQHDIFLAIRMISQRSKYYHLLSFHHS